MMGSGSGDSNAVFSLLAALSDPEAAKAKLKDITEATKIHQKMVDDFTISSQKTNRELEAKKAAVEVKLAEVSKIKADSDAAYAVRSKQLSDLESTLAKRQSTIVETENRHNLIEPKLIARESAVFSKEIALNAKEKDLQELEAKASNLKNSYEAKHEALQAAMGVTHHIMTADTGTLGTVGGRVGSI